MLWKPAFFGVKPALIIKGGMIAAAPMGDPNASIPTPQPVHYRPMFGALGGARRATVVTFVSQAALEDGVAAAAAAGEARGRGRRARAPCASATWIHNDALPVIEVDPQTYEVRADGELLTCEPATSCRWRSATSCSDGGDGTTMSKMLRFTEVVATDAGQAAGRRAGAADAAASRIAGAAGCGSGSTTGGGGAAAAARDDPARRRSAARSRGGRAW